MKKGKFERVPPRGSVGTIGHIGNGKTTLVGSVAVVLAEIERNQEAKKSKEKTYGGKTLTQIEEACEACAKIEEGVDSVFGDLAIAENILRDLIKEVRFQRSVIARVTKLIKG